MNRSWPPSGPIGWAPSATRSSVGSRRASTGDTRQREPLALSTAMLHLRSDSLATTSAIAASLAGLARRGDLIVLAGEMGAGKTAFAKGFGEAMGVTEPITSPTYTLIHSYPAGRVTFHHADIYRLTTHHEVADLALAELLESDGIVMVEWGDVVAGSLGDHVLVRLDFDESDTEARNIAISAAGRAWAARWDEIERRLAGFAC